MFPVANGYWTTLKQLLPRISSSSFTQVRDLIAEHGYDADKTPVIFGSALCALNGTKPELGEQSIIKLMEAVDTHIPIPVRNVEGPFYFPVSHVVSIKGTLTTGVIGGGEGRSKVVFTVVNSA